MIVGVMGTALISPLYALYRQSWHLQASDVSVIYVMYMAGALCSLLFLGRLPDRVGFRPVMVASLVLVLAGTVISLAARGMFSLVAGRFVVGVASSMMTTGATVGMAALSRPGDGRRVATMTGFLMAVGFGLGPLLGGIMGQWAPAPLVTTYIPTLLLGVCGLVALLKLKLPARVEASQPPALRWRDALPRLTWPERAVSNTFVLACTLPFLSFGVFGLYAAMAPLFLEQLLPWHGPVVSGTTIAVILLASACVQITAGRLPPHWGGSLGLLGLAASNALLLANLWTGSALVFVLGVACTAIGHGLSMVAGMRILQRIARPDNRAGLLATYLVIGYVGSMLPTMGIGWIADAWGMKLALGVFCSLVVLLGLAAALLLQRDAGVRRAAGPIELAG